MLGENTLFLTKNGFKMLSEINLYDEVMNCYGEFQPVVSLGEWLEVDRVVELSTGELIACDDDMLWNVRKVGEHKDNFMYTYEISDHKGVCEFDSNDELSFNVKTSVFNPYAFAVVVPTEIPDAYLMSSIATRLLLFAGLVDSPICECEPEGIAGKYMFYTHYKNLEVGIVALARTFGWGVKSEVIEGVTVISVYVTSHADEIPVKDPLKRCTKSFLRTYSVKINRVGMIGPDVHLRGREVGIFGGCPLIGYSLVPVK